MKKEIKRSWDYEVIIKVIALLVITILAMNMTYRARGYFAIGGEVLIIPLAIVSKALYRSFKEVLAWN